MTISGAKEVTYDFKSFPSDIMFIYPIHIDYIRYESTKQSFYTYNDIGKIYDNVEFVNLTYG